MKQLPKRFQSWLKFYVWLQSRMDFDRNTTVVQIDGINYNVPEIKCYCFDELISLIPPKDKMAYCAKQLVSSELPLQDVDWLFNLIKAL